MDKKIRVLIVDDEPNFNTSLQGVLQDESYDVVIAMDKAHAQNLVRKERPDVVIVGTIMPRGDAFLLHRWFKETEGFNDIPMVVIDAPTEKQLLRGWRKDEGLRMDAEDYLTKPVEPTAILRIVEKLVDKETSRIKVLVVDDHAIVREGIRTLLELQKDIHVVGLNIESFLKSSHSAILFWTAFITSGELVQPPSFRKFFISSSLCE